MLRLLRFAFALTLMMATASVARAQALMPFSFLTERHILLPATETLYPEVCANGLWVSAQFGGHADPFAWASNQTIGFVTAGGLQVYSDPDCVTPVSSLPFTYWQATGLNAYIKSSSLGASTLTASISGYYRDQKTYTTATNPFVWIGGVSNVWSTNGNWSGGVAPNNTQVAYFDNSCTTFCSPSITANLDVGGVKIAPTYAGTITQNAGVTLTVQNRGWVQNGGRFNGSAATVTINGPFYLNGGTYQATSGTTRMTGYQWRLSGTPTFLHNGGTLQFDHVFGVLNLAPGTVSYNNFSVTNRQGAIDIYGGTMNVDGNLFVTSNDCCYPGGYYGGKIRVKGNYTITGIGSNGRTPIEMAGSANQIIDASGATDGNVPSVYIASTGGTVSMAGFILNNYEWRVNSGTVAPGNSTLYLRNTWDPRVHKFGPEVYKNVYIYSGGGELNLSSSTLSVGGTLSIDGYWPGWITDGTISARGDIKCIAQGLVGGSNSTVRIEGTTSQTIDYSACGAGTYNHLPYPEFKSTGGVITLLGSTITFGNGWKYTSGNVNTGTTTIKTWMSDYNPKYITPGTLTYYNMELNGSNPAYFTTSLTVTKNLILNSGYAYEMPNPGTGYAITVGGTLTLGSSSNIQMYGATISAGSLINNGTIYP